MFLFFQLVISSMMCAHRMAESKSPSEKSSGGSVRLKTLIRTFSMKKRKENEVDTKDDTASYTKPAFPDTQSKIDSLLFHFSFTLLYNSRQ